MQPRIAVTHSEETATLLQQRVQLLSKQLQLPVCSLPDVTSYDYVLLLTPERLELKPILASANVGTRSLIVDFLNSKLTYRRLHGGGYHQQLARAVGVRPTQPLSVLDATAGLGQDAFVLASLGCQIQMIERSPIIAALLKDGLSRLHHDPLGQQYFLTLETANALDTLRQLQNVSVKQRPDVIYLDPMFPERGKSALVKKNMRILHDIVGKDVDDADHLLSVALETAQRRVVVKRPILASALGTTIAKPNYVLRGKSNRYDIYLTSHAPRT